MSAEQIFIDTNILVYAHNRDAGDKYRMAKEKVRRVRRPFSGVKI